MRNVHVAPVWVRRPVLFVVLLLLIGVSALGRGRLADGGDTSRYHNRVFTVVNVVDGDTLDIDEPDGACAHTRIRLWGVDTPEVTGSRHGAMYFGAEASAFAKDTLAGKQVRVLLSPTRSRGKYGRLLAYVVLEDNHESFNEMLITGGYAYADWRFDHPFKTQYKQLERRARKRGEGLWANVTLEQMPAWRRRMETELFGDLGRSSAR